jgi:hypothetical protein
MATLYLACLIVGGFLLVTSVFLADTDTDLDGAGDDSSTTGADTARTTAGGDTTAVRFFSFRTLIFFVAFFGLTGSLMSLVSIPPRTVALAALAMGAVAALAGFWALVHHCRADSETAPPARVDPHRPPGERGNLGRGG